MSSENQASLLLCNLAGQHGLPKAREMLAEFEATKAVEKPAPASKPAPVKPEPVAPVPAVANDSAPVDPAKAQRDAENEGAKAATKKQLQDALNGLQIPFKPTASKADLLALFIARP